MNLILPKKNLRKLSTSQKIFVINRPNLFLYINLGLNFKFRNFKSIILGIPQKLLIIFDQDIEQVFLLLSLGECPKLFC